ncbi:amidohydrolase family protein [Burkholderia metallica]|uniref:amidohydrolase family protein n=1 Tax=Burkholderia metallica TaxID=488729 RepID=UPI001452D5D8|nr:amidohydrolase family protein [Burkholderia metallica]VWB28438.1 amidohydrolase family protein [Burkholderia metallica]
MMHAESLIVTPARALPPVAPAPRDDDAWALVNALVFDSRAHVLRQADVEIAAGEIVAVVPAGAARVSRRIDASGLLCAPGLAGVFPATGGAQADALPGDALSRSLARGITLTGCLTADVAGDLPRAMRAGGRVVLFATLTDRWVGPGDGPPIRSVDGCLLEYARALQAADEARARVVVAPAIGSQLAASPRLVLALHEAARRRGGRFAVRIDGGGEYASQFRDAYGCSGVALLRSLDALDSHVLAYPATPLGSHERSMLRASGAHVVGATPAQGGEAAVLAWSGADAGFDAWLDVRRRERRAASAAWRARDAAAELVDSLTWKGARALGLADAGRVATGQRADLLLYDRPPAVRERPAAFDAAAFLELVAHTRPAAVLVDGEWAIGAPPAAAYAPGGPSADDFAIRFAR